MWFSELADVENPGREELQGFVSATIRFLAFVVEQEHGFEFLWEDAPGLRLVAKPTFEEDVFRSARELTDRIPRIRETRLLAHGLLGRPLRFKLLVLDVIGRRWPEVREKFSRREWFRKYVAAIDAILDSLVAAAGGTGGLLKEFKDALAALAGPS